MRSKSPSPSRRRPRPAAIADPTLRAHFDACPVAVVALDLEGRVTVWNRAAQALLGWTEAETLGRPYRVVPPGEKAAHRGILEAVRRGETVRGRRVRRRRKDGRLVEVELTVSPVYGPDGAAAGALGLLLEVTPARAALEALRLKKERVRTLGLAIERSPVSVMVTGPQGRIEFVNPMFTELTGYTLAEARGQTPRLLKSGAHPEAFYRGLWRTIAAGRVWRGEVCNRRKDGSLFWVSATIAPIEDAAGRVVRYVGIQQDITALQEAHRRLAHFRELLDQAKDAIAVTDPETGVVLDANQTFLRMFGCGPSDLGRLTVPELDASIPDLAGFRRAIAPLREGGSLVLASTATPRGGAPFPIELSLSLGRQGGKDVLIAVIRDVTARRELEQQLIQAQKMEGIGRLAGGIAHDFNNLLTAIFGYAQLLAGTLPEGDERREDVEGIRQTAERAAALTKKLLAFSRRAVANPKPTDLNRLLMDMDKMLRRVLGADVELVLLPGEGLWPAQVDSGMLEQVIVNLCVNARDAMPQGGKLTLRLGNEEGRPEFLQSRPSLAASDYVRLSFADTGTGMAPAVLKRVFEPFFTTKPKGKGTGLGLAICYGIVRQSGGQIEVESEEGKGTEFRVFLPRSDGPPEEQPAEAAPKRAARPVGGETVLVVEDEAAVRGLAVRVLRRAGYVVHAAEHGEEGLRAVPPGVPVHLVVSDLVMPRMGGSEFWARFRKDHPEARILFMSGYTDESSIARHGLPDGAAFLEKPFLPRDLLSKAREVLDAPTPG